jgi:hypothetical protein
MRASLIAIKTAPPLIFLSRRRYDPINLAGQLLRRPPMRSCCEKNCSADLPGIASYTRFWWRQGASARRHPELHDFRQQYNHALQRRRVHPVYPDVGQWIRRDCGCYVYTAKSACRSQGAQLHRGTRGPDICHDRECNGERSQHYHGIRTSTRARRQQAESPKAWKRGELGTGGRADARPRS